ncbi:MAG: VOC family protein [Proteobacteria bacterium]|nr:VOC family protein [Pseudomonadota bacterium]MDA1325000.1 VOC family protein [Pseudomonadota bacterium]
MAAGTGPTLRPPRLRHTALKVRDLEASIDFYCRLLGMIVARRRQSHERNVRQNRQSAYLAFGDEAHNHALELIQDTDPPAEFVHGNMYSHLNFSVPDLLALRDKLQSEGIEFTEPPTPLSIGDRYHIVFIRDPDGYEIEVTDYP